MEDSNMNRNMEPS